MANTTAFTFVFVNIEKTVCLSVDSSVRAIYVTDTASNAPVLIPLGKGINAIAGLERFGNAFIDKRAFDHLLRKLGCRFQNRSPFLSVVYKMRKKPSDFLGCFHGAYLDAGFAFKA